MSEASSPIDPNLVRDCVETGIPGHYLSRLDTGVYQAGIEIQLEIAEDTFAFLMNVQGDEDPDTTLSKATFYVDTPLAVILEAAPNSDFSALPNDDDYEAYELVYTEVTFRFKFGVQHAESVPIDTGFQALTVAVPTMAAYLEHSMNVFGDHDGSDIG